MSTHKKLQEDLTRIFNTKECGSQEKYVEMLTFLGLTQQDFHIIRNVPKLEEMRKASDKEYLRENQGHYE